MMIKQLLTRGVHTQAGNTLIFTALSMATLISFMFLVLDGSNLYAQRRRMQNAADAGSLAGTRALAAGATDAQIYAAIQEYTLTRNGATSFTAQYQTYNGHSCVSIGAVGTGSIPPNADCVLVNATNSFSTTGSIFLGHADLNVTASAALVYGSIVETGTLWPMAVKWNNFQYGQLYQLWGDRTGPGGFGWLDWNGPPVGTPELANNILNPSNSGEWEVGDLVPSGPGVRAASSVDSALNYWEAKPEDQRHVTVIVYDYTQGQGANMRYHIVAFAEFIPTAHNFSGSDKWIQGKFIQWVSQTGEMNAGDNCPYGFCGLKFAR